MDSSLSLVLKAIQQKYHDNVKSGILPENACNINILEEPFSSLPIVKGLSEDEKRDVLINIAEELKKYGYISNIYMDFTITYKSQ